MLDFLFNKVAGHLRPAILLGTPVQAFSSEYCEIFKNTNSEEHLRTAASVYMVHLNKGV